MDTKNTTGQSCSCTPDPQAPECSGLTDNPPVSAIRTTDSTVTPANLLDHFLARWGWRRESHRVEPGLYRLGNPDHDSPVFASANYTLSFGALRSALAGIDAWILVLDSRGINVWCAAGKGTFGTVELLNRIEVVGLKKIVSHRRLILPQLGATGVSAHQAREGSGFHVFYGPVRAEDIPAFMQAGMKATPEMRQITFPPADDAQRVVVDAKANIAISPMPPP